ncbi:MULTISPECIES: MBL fold metallo-hydrolase [unclassified Pseudoclavibacter]|uniref:MBL fold metallo-hydrolase n=1 Tax=unclassified Pseudoclavibacter TaxID=2615177 RepID=UPI0015E475AA|nr:MULTISPECIES: MBL fold metallo-hydrolase [unclassified Pseudoclavibacter]MBF4549145.1 MBL fold metallo-hydrolase [Pseudoclavibacter sp. VKM Ac-2888]
MSARFVGESFGHGFDTNSYVVFDEDSLDAVIVDPGKGSTRWLLPAVASIGVRVHGVLLTHGHMDHSWDAQPLSDELDVPVYVGASDLQLLVEPESGLPPDFPSHALVGYPRQLPKNVFALPGPEIHAGNLHVTAHAVPGHTAGSFAYLIGIDAELLCSGDSYFASSPPQAIAPTGDPRALRESLDKLVTAGIGTHVILPGHGPVFTGAQEDLGS